MMPQKKRKNRIYLPILTQPIISRERAKKEKLLVLSLAEYSEKFHVHRNTAYHRIRTRKVRAFKHSGKWFIVVSEKSKDGYQ